MVELSQWLVWGIFVVGFSCGYVCRVWQTYSTLKAWSEVPEGEKIRASRLAGYWSYQTLR